MDVTQSMLCQRWRALDIKNSNMKSEYITPAITPFTSDGDIDMDGLKHLYDHLMQGGISGVLILGSIGEFFSISLENKKKIIRYAVDRIGAHTKVLAGTGGMMREEIIELSHYALEAGVNGVVIISPYYFSLTQESIYEFYASIAKEVPGDIYIYNFPDRTGYNIAPETMRRLAEEFPNIIGCKDTLSGMDHTRNVITQVKTVRPDFKVYSGFDDNFAYNILSGGDGCIGGLSNIIPGFFAEWMDAFAKNDMGIVCKKQQMVNCLMDIYGVGTPFVPYIKAAMKAMGIIQCGKASFPFPEVDERDIEKILKIIKNSTN